MATSESKSFLLTGSAEGAVRALRLEDGGKVIEPAGNYEGERLSFLALGARLTSGELRVFTSHKGSLSALVFDPSRGTFTKTHTTPTAGSGTFVTVADSPSAPATIFVAHYHEHCVSCFSFDEESGFGAETVLQPGHNPHQTKLIGGALFVPCLGSDALAVYRPGDGAFGFESERPQRIAVPGGPRHLAFTRDERDVFVLCELSSRIECLSADDEGTIRRRPEWSTVTHPDGGGHWSSDIALSPDEQRLFALNRDPSELVSFKLSEGAAPVRSGCLSLTAPIRSFSMDPCGSALHLGGEDGILHAVSIEGAPLRLGRYEGLGSLRHTARVEL